MASAWEAWRSAEDERARHAAEIASIRANADYVSHALDELVRLDPQTGEEEALASRRQLMMHAEKIAGELNEALDALQGEGTSGARLAAALRRIERQTGTGGALLASVAEALERVLAETDAARAKIEEALAATAFEPHELERAEERLFALRALARKHRVGVDDLPAFVARLETELAALEQGETRLDELTAATEAARDAYASAASSLSEARKEAAARLDEEVLAELAPLKLDKARLITRIETVSLHDGGPQRHRPRCLLGAHQSRHRAWALDEGRLGRRARPRDPRAESGARGARLGPDARLRRGRCRRWRRHCRRRRRAPGAARRQGAGPCRDPCAAGGCARQ